MLSIGIVSSTPITVPSVVCLFPMRMGMPRNAACCLAVCISAKSGQAPVEVSVSVYSRTVSCEAISHLAPAGAYCRKREKAADRKEAAS